MAKYITQKIKAKYVQVLNDLRNDIGRNVTVVSAPTTRTCPNCKKLSDGTSGNVYDPEIPYPTAELVAAGIDPTGPIDFVSLGIRKCVICQGKGTIILAANNDEIKCLINPLSAQDPIRSQLGKNFTYLYELGTTIEHRALFMNAKTLIIDGNACEVLSITPTGIGDLSQILILAGKV